MTWRRVWTALATLALALGGVLVAAPSVAQAVWSCHLGYNSYSDWAWCDFGAGGVRAAGYCWDGSTDTLYYGPWKPAGQTSTMICGGGRLLDGAWYQTF